MKLVVVICIPGFDLNKRLCCLTSEKCPQADIDRSCALKIGGVAGNQV